MHYYLFGIKDRASYLVLETRSGDEDRQSRCQCAAANARLSSNKLNLSYDYNCRSLTNFLAPSDARKLWTIRLGISGGLGQKTNGFMSRDGGDGPLPPYRLVLISTGTIVRGFSFIALCPASSF